MDGLHAPHEHLSLGQSFDEVSGDAKTFEVFEQVTGNLIPQGVYVPGSGALFPFFEAVRGEFLDRKVRFL
ncbi:MAG: hypothetical protein AUI33_14870 [Ignavibacteria bacterium 13_1_40CM_2_61_4]|nr:MAG: hypothetical protein AUI33_14870 [Ignavibacteria bacterium 13_1_40CM_2_61_4]